MGGGGGDTETTTNPWHGAQGSISQGLGWASDIVQNMANNVPTMGNLESNSMLQGAWDQMSGSGMNDLAKYMGQAGADMMGQYDAKGVANAYEQIAAGPNLYNQQSQAATLMAGKEAYLEDMNAASMKQLDKAMAQSTGQIYGKAAGDGNVGSSRTQLASGMASGELASNQAATMSKLYSDSYDTTMQQAMANEQARLSGLSTYAQGQQGLMSGAQSLLGAAGNTYQQSMNNMLQAGTGQMSFDQQNQMINYQNAMNQWMAPQNLVGWYSGIAQGAGGLGGVSVSSGGNQMMNSMMNMMGSIGSSYAGTL